MDLSLKDDAYSFSTLTHELAYNVIALCKEQGLRIGTAESCTGGLIASALTEVDGASAVVNGGIVAYSNAIKRDLLEVSPALIEEEGAVSELVARAMAEGALRALSVDVAVSVTGIAGPSGGTVSKPVGLVHMAVVCRGSDELHVQHREWHFGDHGRAQVRGETVREALKMVYNMLANRKYVA